MHKIEINPVVLERGRRNRDGRDQAFETIDMSKTAHIVVDMQTGFCAEGSVSEVPLTREIVPNINAISQAVRDAGGMNIFLRYTYDPKEKKPWTSWYGALLGRPFSQDLIAHFTPGAAQHALYPEIDVATDEHVLDKTRFSGFTPGTCDLQSVLEAKGIDTVIITGTLTNCCSEATARDAHQLDYKVIFVTDGNATLTDEEHNGTLANLYAVFADTVPTETVLRMVHKGAVTSAAAE